MNTNRLVVLDLETTGLNPESCEPIQIGVIIVTNRFETVAEKEWTIGIDDRVQRVGGRLPNVYNEMHWEAQALAMHVSSGLHAQCCESDLTLSEADEEVASWIKANGAEQSPLVGNNVGAFDRQFLRRWLPKINSAFLRRWLPKINSALHYRHIDVSAAYVMAQVAGVEMAKGERRHTALSDARDSLISARLLLRAVENTVNL